MTCGLRLNREFLSHTIFTPLRLCVPESTTFSNFAARNQFLGSLPTEIGLLTDLEVLAIGKLSESSLLVCVRIKNFFLTLFPPLRRCTMELTACIKIVQMATNYRMGFPLKLDT
jgi:hypothetical protein